MDSETRKRWRWNPDLRVARETRGGEEVAVLHDPAHDEYFQLGIVEFELAQAFDGTRDLEAVRLARAAHGSEPPSLENLVTFAEQLAEAHLLLPVEGAHAPDAFAPRPRPRRTWWRRLLHIEIAALRPETFFDRLAPHLRWFFSAPAFAAGTGLVLMATWVVLGSWGQLRSGLSSISTEAPWVVVWILYGMVVVVHEMAHGFACAHFGGRVRAMGFLLLYGKPCAYCDVSDAWLLPKSARLWIMAAGSLVELGMWAAAALVWRVTAPETLLHRGALVILALCGVGTLLNFNPLLKFDGYYMLSDGLEIPNLRERAFRDLGRRFLHRPRDPATARERRVFWIYGVAALAYSTLVIGFLAARLHGWMVSTWGTAGSFAFWGTVSAVAARPLFRSTTLVVAWLRGVSRSRR